jgi:hypothetical protein
LHSKFEAGASSSVDTLNDESIKDTPPKNQFKDTQEKMKTLLVHSKIFENSIKKFSSKNQ